MSYEKKIPAFLAFALLSVSLLDASPQLNDNGPIYWELSSAVLLTGLAQPHRTCVQSLPLKLIPGKKYPSFILVRPGIPMAPR
jgi:hypothetical protein